MASSHGCPGPATWCLLTVVRCATISANPVRPARRPECDGRATAARGRGDGACLLSDRVGSWSAALAGGNVGGCRTGPSGRGECGWRRMEDEGVVVVPVDGRAIARDFSAAFADALAARRGADTMLDSFVARLRELAEAPAHLKPAEPFVHPTMAHLSGRLASLRGPAPLTEAARRAAHAVHWYQIYQGEGFSRTLSQGMLAGQVAGQAGLVSSELCRTGLFLLAPGVHYPLHTHGADEIYFCVSGHLHLQYGHASSPFTLAPGEHARSPSNRVHSLTVGDEPVLLLYIWIGDVDSPNLAWEKAPDGRWMQAHWVRQPDASWKRVELTPVPPEVVAAEA
ncbi:MAG: cupin domain-containing protein [Rhizobiales bacterium]|nr:cupin domain-containing protein [Hyphomicrobiales bacterium]